MLYYYVVEIITTFQLDRFSTFLIIVIMGPFCDIVLTCVQLQLPIINFKIHSFRHALSHKVHACQMPAKSGQ